MTNLGSTLKYDAFQGYEIDFKKSLRTGDANDWNKYKKARNKVNNLIKDAKERFYNNLVLSISGQEKKNFG